MEHQSFTVFYNRLLGVPHVIPVEKFSWLLEAYQNKPTGFRKPTVKQMVRFNRVLLSRVWQGFLAVSREFPNLSLVWCFQFIWASVGREAGREGGRQGWLGCHKHCFGPSGWGSIQRAACQLQSPWQGWMKNGTHWTTTCLSQASFKPCQFCSTKFAWCSDYLDIFCWMSSIAYIVYNL